MKQDKQRQVSPYAYLFPNLFTTANLFAGFYSIINSTQMYFVEAAWALIIASFFDLMDGRVARLTGATSKFGVEYDSITDVVSFGVAPAILLYQWSFEPFGKFGLAAAFVFLACGAIRLARFNVTSGSAPKGYFQGLPIPVAAMFVATGILFQDKININMSIDYLPLAFVMVLSALMVSTLPFYSFKEVKFSVGGKQFLFLILGVLTLGLIIYNPEVMMFVMVAGYISLAMIWGILLTFKLQKIKKGFNLPQD